MRIPVMLVGIHMRIEAGLREKNKNSLIAALQWCILNKPFKSSARGFVFAGII